MTTVPRIRAATAHDLLGLMSVKPDAALHRERLARQDAGEWVYLLAADACHHAAYGFVLLIWSGDEHHVGHPILADLLVREPHRGQGIGTRLMERAEWLCQDRGLTRLGLSVNPTENRRAHALYTRHGYRPTGAPPHCDIYPLTDDQGRFRLYEDWCIPLVKDLTQEQGLAAAHGNVL